MMTTTSMVTNFYGRFVPCASLEALKRLRTLALDAGLDEASAMTPKRAWDQYGGQAGIFFEAGHVEFLDIWGEWIYRPNFAVTADPAGRLLRGPLYE